MSKDAQKVTKKFEKIDCLGKTVTADDFMSISRRDLEIRKAELQKMVVELKKNKAEYQKKAKDMILVLEKMKDPVYNLNDAIGLYKENIEQLIRRNERHKDSVFTNVTRALEELQDKVKSAEDQTEEGKRRLTDDMKTLQQVRRLHEIYTMDLTQKLCRLLIDVATWFKNLIYSFFC